MPTGQALITAIQTSGAIKLSGGTLPTFRVNFAALRAVLLPEQAAMLVNAQNVMRPIVIAGGPVTANPRLTERIDTGNITLTPPGGGQPSTIPVEVKLGCDGSGSNPGIPGVPKRGVSVILDGRTKSGHILIAVGGNGGPGTDGGDAQVIGDAENLLIALGGNGYPAGLPGARGTNGGDATAVGLGSGNDLVVQGGAGQAGAVGAAGAPGAAGTVIIPMIPGSPGGRGGDGGDGGVATAVGPDATYALAQGGAGGSGGPAGGPGAGAPAPTIGPVPVGTAAPAGGPGLPGDGGDGGNYSVRLGPTGVTDPACAGGAGGPPGPATPAGAASTGASGTAQ